MRISDWSSDVCSSDLDDTAHPSRPTRHCMRLDRDMEGTDHDTGGIGLQSKGTVDDDGQGLPKPPEHGRETTRAEERREGKEWGSRSRHRRAGNPKKQKKQS